MRFWFGGWKMVRWPLGSVAMSGFPHAYANLCSDGASLRFPS
jgi:hypothetical protein